MSAKDFKAAVLADGFDPSAYKNVTVEGDLDLAACFDLECLPEGLTVKGNLDLTECGDLVHLPEGLTVEGNLIISDSDCCMRLEDLPAGLKVGGDLVLDGCEEVHELPADLEVGGKLEITNCARIKELPTGVKVGELSVKNCKRFEGIAEGATILGDVEISNCKGFITVPYDWHVKGNLKVESCRNFKSYFMRELRVDGDFSLKKCSYWKTLPPGTQVGGTCKIKNCKRFEGLPEGFVTSGDFELKECAKVTEIPADAAFGASVAVGDCSGFATFPEGFKVPGTLQVSSCPSVVELPEGVEVGRNLTILRCDGLVAIPRFQAGGGLALLNCENFESFSDGFAVGSDFRMSDCPRAQGLPNAFDIGDDVTIRACPRVVALPARLFELGASSAGETRDVTIEGTGLSVEVLTRIGEAEHEGIRVYVSLPRVDTSEFPNLGEALAFWNENRPGGVPELAVDFDAWDMDDDQREELLSFLSRMRATAECSNIRTRRPLAGRILQALGRMNEDTELRGQCLGIVSTALVSCDDRIIHAMGQVEMGIRLYEAGQAEATEEQLRALALGLMRLEVVHKHADAKIPTLAWVDEVEVYLAYETKLAEPLGLPVSTTNMIFETMAQVTDADIAAAKAEAEAIDDAALDGFLGDWEPWQRLQRRKGAAEVSWEAVAFNEADAIAHADDFEDAMCCISAAGFADLKEPVYLDGDATHSVFELEDLMAWYREKGTHPATKEPIDLSKLRRAVEHPREAEAGGADDA